jgi:hypothetical protein
MEIVISNTKKCSNRLFSAISGQIVVTGQGT